MVHQCAYISTMSFSDTYHERECVKHPKQDAMYPTKGVKHPTQDVIHPRNTQTEIDSARYQAHGDRYCRLVLPSPVLLAQTSQYL
jgi:hypothetical protein